MVTSASIGATEIAHHEEDALLFECRKASQMADNILRALKNDSERAALAQNGRQRAEREFSREPVMSSYLDVYRQWLCKEERRMGMFDSLYIELDGREHEIQTKRFDSALARYRVGDWIGGAPPGIRVYFDILHLDAKGDPVYSPEDKRVRTLTLFFALAHGVFVEYQIRDGELAADAIAAALSELRERWSDSARLIDFLVDALHAKQHASARLRARLARVAAVVESARRLRAGETLGGVLGLIHDEDRRLADGDDPIEVVASVLDDDTPGWGLWGDGTRGDPLDEYRL